MFGFEYTRLIQSKYYNVLPSPNWYDNPKIIIIHFMEEDGLHIQDDL